MCWLPSDNQTWQLKIPSRNGTSMGKSLISKDSCSMRNVRFPTGYLVVNYPRIVSGLVHPSFLSGQLAPTYPIEITRVGNPRFVGWTTKYHVHEIPIFYPHSTGGIPIMIFLHNFLDSPWLIPTIQNRRFPKITIVQNNHISYSSSEHF